MQEIDRKRLSETLPEVQEIDRKRLSETLPEVQEIDRETFIGQKYRT